MFDIPPESSLLEVHTGTEGRRGSPRILGIPNHQQEQINESCETIEKQINVNQALHSDMNELKASDVPSDFVVIFVSIYSTIYLSRGIYMFGEWSG